jgi:FAD/FMN-containing dehydrogenase
MATALNTRPPAATLERIQAIVGPKGWTTDPAILAPHLLEERGHYRGQTAMLIRPASTEEVAAVVRVCAETKTPIVPQGGNTSMMGGATPFEHGGEIILSLARMNRLRAVDPLNYTMTAEAGCVLASLQQAAENADRLFPLSLGAEGTCQIGGNLSTNAGGVQVLRYGMARDLVLGLEVVLPDGSVIDGLRGLRKDNTGYDLKHLFLGAEGTLGIITAAVLKLYPRPRETETAFVAVRDPKAAIELLAEVRGGTGDAVTAFELISRTCLEMALRHIPGTADPLTERHAWYVLMDCSSGDSGGGLREALERSLAGAMEKGLVLDAALAASAQQSKAMWRIRDSLTEAQKPEGGSIKHDISVPVSSVADFIAEATAAVSQAIPGIRPVTFGHVGDGNIHFNLSQPADQPRSGPPLAAYLARWGEINRIVHDIVARMQGSISAEHGIGRRKIDELVHYKSPVEIALMRTLKRTLDPHNIMNPGKVVRP